MAILRRETPGAACRSSFLPRKYLIGMDKRLKLAPFGSDPFSPLRGGDNGCR